MGDIKKVTINGRQYDAHTGMALDVQSLDIAPATPKSPAAPKHHAHTPSQHMHTSLQRSHTLNRRTLASPHKKPAHHATTPAAHPRQDISVRTSATHTHPTAHQQSPRISKFAPHATEHHTRPVMDVAPATHPHVHKAHEISKIKAEAPLPDAPAKRLTSQEIKQSALQQAIHNTPVNHQPVKHRVLKRHPRTLGILSATLALVMLGGYFTYINMPSISTRVAAAEAGINAQYPSYRPDGYSLNGLVGYRQDIVTMRFASNSGPQSFVLNQAKSSWDSSAVLDNYVAPRAGTDYIPYAEQGLTIYMYGNNAAWVNGGILYTIEGNAPLSSEQIRHIATSLI